MTAQDETIAVAPVVIEGYAFPFAKQAYADASPSKDAVITVHVDIPGALDVTAIVKGHANEEVSTSAIIPRAVVEELYRRHDAAQKNAEQCAAEQRVRALDQLREDAYAKASS